MMVKKNQNLLLQALGITAKTGLKSYSKLTPSLLYVKGKFTVTYVEALREIGRLRSIFISS